MGVARPQSIPANLQPKGLSDWVAAQWNAVCVEMDAAAKVRLWQRVRPLYRLLLAAGYDIPLSIVLDLACLYEYGPDKTVYEPPTWPGKPLLRSRYCQALRQDLWQSGFRDALNTAQRATRSDDGLRAFLDAAVSGLCRTVLEQKGKPINVEADTHLVPDGIRNAIQAGDLLEAELPTGGKSKSDDYNASVLFLNAFLDLLLKSGSSREEGPFGRAFVQETNRQLVRIGVSVPRGAEGTDLFVLQACQNYAPLTMDATQMARYQRVLRTLSMRQQQSSRSSESGNHGIKRSGSPSEVVRTVLVHDDFIDRIYLKQAFYLDRRANRQEPHRVLLGWNVDRSHDMRESTSMGIAKDTHARQIAAYLLEDAARALADMSALELQAAVVLYDSTNYQYLPRVLPVLAEELRQVSNLTGRHNSSARTWLPNLNNFLPHFFVRTPVWKTQQPGSEAVTSSPERNAVRALYGTASMQRMMLEADSRDPYDLCCLTLIGSTVTEAQVRNTLAALNGLAEKVILFCISCEQEKLSWAIWPRSVRSLTADDCEEYTTLSGETFQPGTRKAAWNVLLHMVQTL